MTAWPCTECGADGVRNLGTEGFCPTHLALLYSQFEPSVFQLQGVGLPGRTNDTADLTCAACGATWVGLVGEWCQWCANALAKMQEWAADEALTPPDLDPDDARWPGALEAWTERLWAAVRGGLVTQRMAESAVRRTVVQRVA